MMWYKTSGKENDIVLNSRVMLMRNVSGYPFSERMTDDQKKELSGKVREVLTEADGWVVTDFKNVSEDEKISLAEKRMISRSFAGSEGVLLFNEEKAAAVMLFGENHICIQCTVPGFDVDSATETAYEIEGKLDEKLEFSFSEQFGYLTYRASDIGTGMKATVTMHLPVFSYCDSIRSLAYQLSGLGMGIRTMHGAGENACLYQVTAPSTAGLSEDELLKQLKDTVMRIMNRERDLRQNMSEERKNLYREQAMRRIGMMMYSGYLRADEILEMYSPLRLAAELDGAFIKPETVDELLFSTLPHTMMTENKECKSVNEIDRKRAEKVKLILPHM